MFELFVIGTFWFWLLIATEIILLFAFIENENGIGATVSVFVFAALLQWFGNVDIISYLRANPMFIVSCLGDHFAPGAVWCIIKWRIFCRDRLEDYEEARAKFLKERGQPAGTKVVPVELRAEWKEAVENSGKYGYGYSGYKVSTKISADPPQVREYKSQIMRWMTFWVISMIWSLINDFVKRVFRSIYLKLATFLQSISDKMWRNVKGDFEVNSVDSEESQ